MINWWRDLTKVVISGIEYNEDSVFLCYFYGICPNTNITAPLDMYVATAKTIIGVSNSSKPSPVREHPLPTEGEEEDAGGGDKLQVYVTDSGVLMDTGMLCSKARSEGEYDDIEYKDDHGELFVNVSSLCYILNLAVKQYLGEEYGNRTITHI